MSKNTTTTVAQQAAEHLSRLRRRGQELGIEGAGRMDAKRLEELIAAVETRKPLNADDFGDLGPVVAAPDDAAAPPVSLAPPPEPPRFVPPVQPPAQHIVITPEQFALAIKAGQVTGLPEVDKRNGPTLNGREIALGEQRSEVTATIGNHAVQAIVATRTVLVSWVVQGSAEDLSGKLRLMNDVPPIVVQGVGMVRYRAGQEFYPHQLGVAVMKAIEAAGGVFLPIGKSR